MFALKHELHVFCHMFTLADCIPCKQNNGIFAVVKSGGPTGQAERSVALSASELTEDSGLS